jgi:hypothetical protein
MIMVKNDRKLGLRIGRGPGRRIGLVGGWGQSARAVRSQDSMPAM